MFGFKFSPSSSTVLALQKGIRVTLTILSPLVSTKSSTTLVVTPVLVCVSTVSVISLVTCSPACHSPPCEGSPLHAPFDVDCTSEDTTEGSPTHVVCHEFQTVPSEFSTEDLIESKLPSLLILTSGSCVVSCHISVPGVNFNVPWNENTL